MVSGKGRREFLLPGGIPAAVMFEVYGVPRTAAVRAFRLGGVQAADSAPASCPSGREADHEAEETATTRRPDHLRSDCDPEKVNFNLRFQKAAASSRTPSLSAECGATRPLGWTFLNQKTRYVVVGDFRQCPDRLLTGSVVSDKAHKTDGSSASSVASCTALKKFVRRSKKYASHDRQSRKIGDACDPGMRPISNQELESSAPGARPLPTRPRPAR